MTPLWANLHFLRPLWFWALLALPALWWISGLRRRKAAVWRKVVDPHLLPRLLEPSGPTRFHWAPLLRSLGFLIAVVILAGPSWRQVEQPLWQTERPLVIALDLSSNMSATDLPPSRLIRAKGKIAALLRDRPGGQVGLVVWADDAFTVAPLTADTANVALFLDALSPSIMPVDGQRADRAIAWSAKLLKQAGFAQGEILLLTDRAGVAATTAAATARQQGYRVSVIGLGSAGTATPAPDALGLGALAQAGGGTYAGISLDERDLRHLGMLDSGVMGAGETATGESSRTWQDQGYLLLPLLMLWVLPLFRRGAALPAILLACCLWPPSLPARAAEPGGWWQRADQVRQQHLDQGVESYRKGDFATAEQAFERVDDAEGRYNLGNALARQGKYDEAITAYNQALAMHPDLVDARHNRDLVEAARQSQSSSSHNNSSQAQSSQQSGNGSGQQASPDSDGQQSPSSSATQSGVDPSSNDPQSSQSRSDSDNGDQGESSSSDTQSGQKRDGAGTENRSSGAPQLPDQESQDAADAEQQRRMQEALRQRGESSPQPDSITQGAAGMPDESAEEREQRQAREAWLQRVPDDPGGLLRTKFRLEYERRRRAGNE